MADYTKSNRVLNGIGFPIGVLMDETHPFQSRVYLLLLYWADLGYVGTNDDLRNVLFVDYKCQQNRQKLLNALRSMASKGLITREDGMIHIVPEALPPCQGDPRLRRLTAIENRIRGHKAKTGGWRYASLRSKLMGRKVAGLDTIRWRIPMDRLEWLWNSHAFDNPGIWHDLPADIANRDAFTAHVATLTGHGLHFDADELAVLMAVETLAAKHNEGVFIKNHIGYARKLLQGMFADPNEIGIEKNDMLDCWNLGWLTETYATLTTTQPAGYTLAEWAGLPQTHLDLAPRVPRARATVALPSVGLPN